jgi:hypothetical protein
MQPCKGVLLASPSLGFPIHQIEKYLMGASEGLCVLTGHQ